MDRDRAGCGPRLFPVEEGSGIGLKESDERVALLSLQCS